MTETITCAVCHARVQVLWKPGQQNLRCTSCNSVIATRRVENAQTLREGVTDVKEL